MEANPAASFLPLLSLLAAMAAKISRPVRAVATVWGIIRPLANGRRASTSLRRGPVLAVTPRSPALSRPLDTWLMTSRRPHARDHPYRPFTQGKPFCPHPRPADHRPVRRALRFNSGRRLPHQRGGADDPQHDCAVPAAYPRGHRPDQRRHARRAARRTVDE